MISNSPASNLAHLYQRVSSAAQLLGDGLDRQLDGTKRYVDEKALVIVTTYSDRGVSAFRGKNRRVGELALILRHIETGVIRPGEHLVIESLDRLSRQPPLEALETLKAILKRGVIVHSIFDNTYFTLADLNRDVGRLLTLVVSMARSNEESRVKSQRVVDAHRRGRETGKIVAGSIPTWLFLTRDPQTGEKKFGIKTGIQEVVVSMFEMCSRGRSSYRIAQELTANNVPPFSVSKKRVGSKAEGAHHWNATSILDILRGKSVLGEFRSHTISYDEEGKRIQTLASVNPNYYPQIVEPDLWHRANQALDSRKKARTRGRTGATFANLLRDVCVCAHCGNSMHFKIQAEHRTRERYVRFRCAGRSENVCDNTKMPRYAILETAILALVTEIDLVDRRSEDVAALDRLIAIDALRADSLEIDIRTIIDNFKGSKTAAVMVAEKECEKIALQEILARRRHERDVLAGRQSPLDRKAALRSLRDRLEQTSGSELYALRANLNLKIREVVDTVIFDREGDVTIKLSDSDDRYILSGITRDALSVCRVVDGCWEYIGSVGGQEFPGNPYNIYDAREGRRALQRLVDSGRAIVVPTGDPRIPTSWNA